MSHSVHLDGGLVESSPFHAARAATYRVVIVGRQDPTPYYGFRVTDASIQPLVNLDTAITGKINPAWQDNLCLITGARGQRLTYDAEAAASKTARAKCNA